MARNNSNKYFTDGAVLPLHMMLIEEMPKTGLIDRFSECEATRSTQYTCGFFYKHISRPISLARKERDEGSIK
ncbi:MAG: hypothetical protein ACREDR_23420 [Blastocatellia bacterium]